MNHAVYLLLYIQHYGKKHADYVLQLYRQHYGMNHELCAVVQAHYEMNHADYVLCCTGNTMG